MKSLEERKENFIRKANLVHKNKYDYSNVTYINAKTDIIITCPIHGDFIQKPYHHLEGYGCHLCSQEKQKNFDFIQQANKVHHNKYDYSKFVYKNNKTKSTIICPIHGEFTMSMNTHISNGQGCPKCGREITKIKNSLTIEEFIEKSKKVYGEDAFDYSKLVYENNKKPIILICKKCGAEFITRGDNHLNGHGCPKCVNNVSKWENEVSDFISSLHIEYEKSNRELLNGKEIDILVPSKNIGIECDGLRWHCDLYCDKYYHLNKTILAKENGVNLIHLFEDEWKFNKECVKSYIAYKLGVSREKTHARKCEIKNVSEDVAKRFVMSNSILNYKQSTLNYSLFYKDEMVCLLSLTEKEGTYEITNIVTKLNVSVCGGVSKLFTNFIKDKNPKSVVVHNDRRLFNGEIYKMVGFTNVSTINPTFYYVINDKRFEEEPIGKKYQLIYDCGFDVYEYKKSEVI